LSEVNGTPTTARRTTRGRSRLRFEFLNAFVDGGMADLSRAELAVWFCLYRDTKPDETAQTSLADLARRGGMDRQTASRAVGRLERRKMLRVVRRGGLNRGPSVYRLFPYSMG
jgi:DNA-binding MarR family transcriptional regulator